ncbi:MAG: leucine-rich repeat domain-containing protein, partial [Clostridia bacterium]|nr:leucine-rich repeat domain-containing protein [Clostridia bacterium]
MKIKKKLTSFVLIFALLAMFVPSGLLTTTAYAADGDFEITDGVLTGYNGSGGDVVIPDFVKKIGDWAFWDCTGLTNVTIPNSVTSIGESAFSDCSSLKSLTIPNSVRSIGACAFSGCSKITDIYYAGTKQQWQNLSFIANINSNVTVHCNYKPNRDFEITDGVLTGYNGSGGDVVIPDGVTAIGEKVFDERYDVKSITIPHSVTSIGDWAFHECGLTTVTIPDSITAIGEYAFCGCYELRDITLPNSVISIGDSAFCECQELGNITLPEHLKSIGNSTFSTIGLTSISIPNSVTSI